jgi:TP901 family phage tail tape measure protein
MADEIRLDISANTTPMERDIANATRRVGSINLNANVDSRGLENFNRSLGKITGQADEFSKSMEAANARVLAFGASVGVINAISNAFKGLVSSTIEVEKSLTEIKIVGDETFSNLNKTSAGLFSTAKQLGVSYKDAADATLEFARQGKGLSDSLNASKAALALTRTAGISATEAVMGLTSAVNAFGRGAEAYIEYANKMSSVSDAFAVNNKDLIEGMSRSASVAQEAGVSFEELTAFITTLQEKTGRGGAVIGNALKTIFTRIKNPEIIKDLQELGVTIQDNVTGNFLPATKILQNLANEFQSFDKNIRNNILLKVGGGFQVDKFSAIMNDIKDSSGTFQRAFQLAASNNGDILGRVTKLNQTIDSSFTNILTSSKELGANIGQIAFSKDFTNILQNGASLISSLNDAIFGGAGDAEDQGSAIGKAVLKGLGSVISGPGLFAIFGIFAKLSIDFAKFSTDGVKALVGITSKTKEEQLIQTAITNVLSRNADFQKQIFNLEGNRVAQAELLLGVIRQQVNESKKLQEVTSGISPILRDRGVRLSGSSPQIVGSAKGYVPNLADAIAKEKSESPAGSKIIVDRNFPMGGGQRSTMVYNSNETRIKNFAGTGGDAIIPNYPINSARGFVPNFAKKDKKAVQDDGRKSLEVDAANLSVAGLTFAGENKGSIKRAKPVPIDEDLLDKYSGSPYVKVLEQFKNFTLTNVPVGNVYRLRKGLQQSEDEIKADFVQRLNSKFREQTVSFLLDEISGLGLPTGGGVGKNLSNLKLNVIGSSTAGYIFEELLKIPTLSDAEKVAQYASQSDTDYFDIKNLSPEFSEAYGLPKKAFDLVELKFGERELKDGISKKFLNQLVAEGGGANPKKFGQKDTNRAASGYIPNFANLGIAAYQPVMAGRVFEALVKKQNYVDLLENSTDPDFGEYEIKGSLKAALNDKNFGYGRSKGTKLIVPGDADTSLLDQLKKEKFAQVTFSRITNEDTQPIAREMIKKYADSKYIGSLNNLPLVYPKNKSNIKAAAKGYIPNFSELMGTGSGMLYQDPNFNELGGGQSGKFLAPKSNEGFGQKIFYKLGSDKINQELQVNKSIKDFEKENPALFAKNAISFTNVGKLLTKNGLAAGFEREVIGGLGVDEFATGSFSKGGAISPKTNFAFFLSELLAQSGVKNVVGEYRKKYGQDSLSIDDVYAQNFKVNDIMQKLLIDETNQFFKGKKNAKDSDVDNYIRSLNGNPLVNSLNEKFGSAGGRHTMFDTQGFAKNASKGYIPNFANVNADILTANPMISQMSVDEFVNKYLGQSYSTGLSGTSANVKKLKDPSLAPQAKRDFLMSMLGVNFLATFNRDKDANLARKSLMDVKTKTGSRSEYVPGGFMQRAGNYVKPDLTNVIEGTFSGNAKELKYEELDSQAEKIFSEAGLSGIWNNDIINTLMQVADKHSQSEMIGANFDYRSTEEYKKVKAATAILRPALIQGLLGGEKGVQALMLNTPEADKSVVGKNSKYLALLDPNAANLQKYVSNFLINPDREPLDPQSPDAKQNLTNASDIVRTLDTYSPSKYSRKPIRLDALKAAREKARSNAQLRTFFGETAGAFQPIRKGADGSLGTTFKSSFPQEIIDRMAEVLTSTVNRGGIFQLSNLDFGYAGTPQESFEFNPKSPEIDTFKNSPSVEQIPQTILYRKYLEKKDYYKSIAKWKYDQASGSMVRQAAKGYIPNFAKDALEDAVVREQLQSGLPSSQISLTKDSRLANNLNPSGFAVINKRDEPNGKVPANRIADAYKNAGRGFIPNFSAAERATTSLNIAAALGATGTDEANKAAQDYIASSRQASSSQKELSEILKKLKKDLEGGSITMEDLFKRAKDYKSSLEKSGKTLGATGLSREFQSQGIRVSSSEAQDIISVIKQNLNTQTAAFQPASGAAAGSAAATGQQASGGNQQSPQEAKTKKSFSELATNLFVFQSALSFASGAMSGFGANAEKIGESLNDFGQAVIAVTQVGSLAEQIRGGERKKDAGLFEAGGLARSGLASAITVAGGIYAAVQAIGAIDKAILTINGTFAKSKAFVDDLQLSFSKYNIQLSEQSKAVSESIAKKGSVSGSGISGYFNSIGLNYESIFGDKRIAEMQKSLGFTDLSDTANEDITRRALQLITPQIAENYAENNQGKQIGSKELRKKSEERFSADLLRLREGSMTQAKLQNGALKVDKFGRAVMEFSSEKYQKNITKYLESQVVKTQDATIAEQARKDALLFSSDLLKQQLNSYAQISKIQSSIPSMAENQLSVEKELLTTTEARRMEIDRQIKSLSEQRQLTSEIKDTALTFGRERIDKYLGQVSGTLDIRKGVADDIRGAFSSLAGATNEQSATAGVQNVLSKLRTREGAGETEQEKKNREDAIQFLEEQLSVVKANSKAREFQNTLEAQNLAYIKQQNYEYNVRKEAINTQLTLEQRSLDIAKEKLSLTRRKEDTQFETSLIGTASPLQAERARILRDIQNLQTRPAQDIKNEEANFAQARKQAIANLLNEKNVRPETVQEILKQSGSKQIQSVTDELNKERNGFADQVQKSADAFYNKIFDSAELLSDAISKSANAPEKSIVDRLSGVGDLNKIPTKSLEKFKEQLNEKRQSLSSDPNFTEELDVVNFYQQQLDKIAKSESEINKILEDRKKNEYKAGNYIPKNVEDMISARGQKPVLSKEMAEANAEDLKKRLAELEQYNRKFTFKGGMQEVQFQLTDEITTFENKLGKEIPMGFRDSMVSAMRELSNPNSTQPLKERLLGVASAFLNKINEAFMTQAANKLTSGIMGVMPGMASGGYIKGGSGSKDDVPAMLMGGEYVVTKSAVQKYGPAFFDSLNKGSIKKYANGGWVESDVTKYQDPASVNPYGQRRDQGLSFNENGSVIGMDSYTGTAENKQDAMMRAQSDYYAKNAQSGESGFYMPGQNGMGAIMGAQNLLSFATQQTAGTQFDKILGRGNTASIDLGAGSSNMSLFALRDQGNARNAEYLQSKQKSLDLFFSEIDASKEKANREEEIRKEQERIKEEAKKQEKAMIKGILTSLATSAVMAGVGYLGRTMSQGMNAAKQAASLEGRKTGFMEGAISGGTINGVNRGGLSNVFNSRGGMDFSTIGSSFVPESMGGGKGGLYSWNKQAGAYTQMGPEKYNGMFPFGASYDSLGTPTALKNTNLNSKSFIPSRTLDFSNLGFGKDISLNNLNQSDSNGIGSVEGMTPQQKAAWIRSGGGSTSLSSYRKASGGYVPGNGMGDNVPAMLNGGEFVVSKQAAQNIGANKLQQINSGKTGDDSSEMIVAKLHELVEKLSAVGTLNITVNSDSKGNEQSKEEGGNQDKQTKELARKIKEVVMVVLKDEKRLGGMLR